MALSSCIKCGSSLFELVVIEPMGSTTKVSSIQCTNCGGIAGVLGFYDEGVLLTQLQSTVKRIAEKLGVSVNL